MQDHLKGNRREKETSLIETCLTLDNYCIEISQIPFNDDSTLSVSSSQRQQSLINAPYSSSFSSGIHIGLSSMTRGQSYAGHESPVPRASTSSSSLIIPSVATTINTTNTTIPATNSGAINFTSSSPKGSYYQQQSGSPSSFSELERRRASSFGDAKPKGYRPY